MKNLRPLRFGKSRKITRKLLPLLIVIGILMALAIFFATSSSTSTYVASILSGTSLKSTNGKVNILLLGIAGGVHDGASLTDTILVASYELKSNKVYLFSIPRDLWLPSLQSKANAVYEIGLTQKNGLGMAKTIIGNILGLPINYALRLDFRGFISAVDTLGGMDVLVDNAFDDYNYPIEGKEADLCGFEEKEVDLSSEDAKKLNIESGKQKILVAPDGTVATDSAKEDMGAKYFTCRYEHIHFDKGINHLDGVLALKFVRSRHGINGEGSDFARSKRQQKVIEAIRGKLLSFETLTNPTKISELLSTFGKSIDTDISVKDAVEFYKLSKQLKSTHSFVLDDSPKQGLPNDRKTLFISPPREEYGGAYVLISQDDDFSIVQGYVKKILTGEITEYDATASARPGR